MYIRNKKLLSDDVKIIVEMIKGNRSDVFILNVIHKHFCLSKLSAKKELIKIKEALNNGDIT